MLVKGAPEHSLIGNARLIELHEVAIEVDKLIPTFSCVAGMTLIISNSVRPCLSNIRSKLSQTQARSFKRVSLDA